MTPWDDAEKESFLKMQFEAQHSHYQQHFPNASYQIIEKEDEPIGASTWTAARTNSASSTLPSCQTSVARESAARSCGSFSTKRPYWENQSVSTSKETTPPCICMTASGSAKSKTRASTG